MSMPRVWAPSSGITAAQCDSPVHPTPFASSPVPPPISSSLSSPIMLSGNLEGRVFDIQQQLVPIDSAAAIEV